MKKIALFIIAILSSVSAKSQVTFETVYETPNSQITLYILSQGYTTASMGEFNTYSSGFLTALWNTVPFTETQEKFRVILVRDIAATNTFPRSFTQFGSGYDCTSGASTGSESYSTFVSRMDTFISTYIPSYNDKSYLLAVFNNDYYTGGGGKYTFVADYTCGNIPNYMYNVLIHEFGHTFGLLGDEYGPTTASVGPNDFPLFHDRNVTQKTIRAELPWNYLINPATAVPTCTYGSACSSTVPGLYESANYSNTGWYRPQNTCKMLNVGSAFCATCQDLLRETIIKHICIPNNTVTDQFVTRHQYITHWRKASTLLSSNSTIGNTINVNYVSGGSILLTNGFAANSGSDFRAYIGDCNAIDVRNQYRATNSISSTVPPELPIAENLNKGKTVISPNPSSNFVTIDADNQFITNIDLYSVDGKKIFSEKINRQMSFSFDITNFANGTYIITIQTENGETTSKKLIKN